MPATPEPAVPPGVVAQWCETCQRWELFTREGEFIMFATEETEE